MAQKQQNVEELQTLKNHHFMVRHRDQQTTKLHQKIHVCFKGIAMDP